MCGLSDDRVVSFFFGGCYMCVYGLSGEREKWYRSDEVTSKTPKLEWIESFCSCNTRRS